MTSIRLRNQSCNRTILNAYASDIPFVSYCGYSKVSRVPAVRPSDPGVPREHTILMNIGVSVKSYLRFFNLSIQKFLRLSPQFQQNAYWPSTPKALLKSSRDARSLYSVHDKLDFYAWLHLAIGLQHQFTVSGPLFLSPRACQENRTLSRG